MPDLNYDIEKDELRLDLDDVSRDNILALERSLDKIQQILRDIDARLTAGGL